MSLDGEQLRSGIGLSLDRLPELLRNLLLLECWNSTNPLTGTPDLFAMVACLQRVVRCQRQVGRHTASVTGPL